jgi:hypothetical protein
MDGLLSGEILSGVLAHSNIIRKTLIACPVCRTEQLYFDEEARKWICKRCKHSKSIKK